MTSTEAPVTPPGRHAGDEPWFARLARFSARRRRAVMLVWLVDRTAQYEAIACHQSQANDNPVLRRRLQLQGTRERLRYRMPA